MRDHIGKLRVQLTLVNTLVLISMIVFATIFLVYNLNSRQTAEITASLEAYTAQAASDLSAIVTEDQNDTTRQTVQELKQKLDKANAYYMVWDSNFDSVAQSDKSTVAPSALSALAQRAINEDHRGAWTVDYNYGGTTYKICTYPVIANGTLSVVQVVRDLSGVRYVSTGAITAIIFVILIGSAISVGAGIFLTGWALVPIRESTERQQEFLANASHELRTPIAVIRTNLEVVKNDGDKQVSDEKMWLDNAYAETLRTQRIVEDLMLLARADAGEAALTFAPVDLSFLSQTVIERMMPIAAKKGILLLWDAQTDDEILANGDEGLLNQLLVIFIDNAIKYSPENTTVTVSVAPADKNVMFRVADQGVGIAPEDQEKIFNRFYRVDKARSRAAGGTGLGLSIAKWIVSAHHGSIAVDSTPGEGTTFTVTLPAAPKILDKN